MAWVPEERSSLGLEPISGARDARPGPGGASMSQAMSLDARPEDDGWGVPASGGCLVAGDALAVDGNPAVDA
mgnify:CR=1 FL=1